MSKMTPAFQNHPAIKRLSFRRDDDTIVLAPCFPVRVTPVKLERLKFQLVQRKKQVLGPLKAIAAFPPAMINEEIVEDWGAKHVVLRPHSRHSSIGAFRQELCFVWIDSARKCGELFGQFLSFGNLLRWHLKMLALLF